MEYPDTDLEVVNFNQLKLASSLVVPGTCYVFGFVVSSTNVSAQNIMVFDAEKVPGNGAIPLYFLAIAASSHTSVAYVQPRHMDVGLCLVNSTTTTSLTIGAADCLFDVQFSPLY